MYDWYLKKRKNKLINCYYKMDSFILVAYQSVLITPTPPLYVYKKRQLYLVKF